MEKGVGSQHSPHSQPPLSEKQPNPQQPWQAQQPPQPGQGSFMEALGDALSAADQERHEHFNFSERIADLRDQVNALDRFTNNEELDWLYSHLNKDKSKEVLDRLVQLDKAMVNIQMRQESILQNLAEPKLNDPSISKAELAKALSSYDGMSKDVEEMRRAVETIKQMKGMQEDAMKSISELQNMKYQVQALTSNVESLQNTVVALHNKSQLSAPEDRLSRVEQKLAEVLKYLQQAQPQAHHIDLQK